jgi:hypothetical protein
LVQEELVFSQLAEQTRGETEAGVWPRALRLQLYSISQPFEQVGPTPSDHGARRSNSPEPPQIPIARGHTNTPSTPAQAATEPQLRQRKLAEGSPLNPRTRRRAQGTSVRGAGERSCPAPSTERPSIRHRQPNRATRRRCGSWEHGGGGRGLGGERGEP